MILATILFRRAARRNYRKVRVGGFVDEFRAGGERQRSTRRAGFLTPVAQLQKLQGLRQPLLSRNEYDAVKVASIFTPVVDILGAIATALVVYIGGTAVLGESMTPGVLIAFVLYIDRFFDPIRDLSRRFDTLQSTMAAGSGFSSCSIRRVEVLDAADAREMEAIKGSVRFENVSFHYSMIRHWSWMESIWTCVLVRRSHWWVRRSGQDDDRQTAHTLP